MILNKYFSMALGSGQALYAQYTTFVTMRMLKPTEPVLFSSNMPDPTNEFARHAHT